MNPSPFQTPIGLDQHALFLGTTGSGKSFRTALQVRGRLALLQRRGVAPRTYKIVILDTKSVGWGGDDHLGNFTDLLRTTRGMLVWDWRDIHWDDDHYLYVWRIQGLAGDRDNVNAFLMDAQGRKMRAPSGRTTGFPFTIIVDELIDISSTDTARVIYLQGLTKILTTGRASGQTLWVETQTPTYVFGDIKRLSTVRFIFRLPEPDDREYVSKMVDSRLVRSRIPDPFGFFYQNDLIQGGSLVYYNGVR